jgi:GAF domain-containing protein
MTNNGESSEALEQERLEVLQSYEILNTNPDEACDRITTLVAGYFDVPATFLTLVDRDYIWVKAAHGIAAQRFPRQAGISTHVVTAGDLVVAEDAAADQPLTEYSFVSGQPGIGFYAAAPLVTGEGFRLGALGVLDYKPRPFPGEQREALQRFAKTAIDLMDLRLCVRKTLESFSAAFREGDGDHLVTVCAWTRKILVEDEWLTFEEFLNRKLGYGVTHGIHPDAIEELFKEID